MGKMFNTLVLSGIISILLFLLDGSGYLGVIAKFFLSPPSDWWTYIYGALTSALGVASGLGLGAITIGTIWSKQDWLVRLGMFVVLASWVSTPFIQLWTFVSSKLLTTETCLSQGLCESLSISGTTTTLGMIIAGLIVGPLILYALWACWSQIWNGDA